MRLLCNKCGRKAIPPQRLRGQGELMCRRHLFRRLFLHILQDLGLHIAAHMDYTVQRAKAALTIEETANK